MKKGYSPLSSSSSSSDKVANELMPSPKSLKQTKSDTNRSEKHERSPSEKEKHKEDAELLSKKKRKKDKREKKVSGDTVKTAKRSLEMDMEDDDDEDPKSAKTKDNSNDDIVDKKEEPTTANARLLFQKVWSDEDVLQLLQATTGFVQKNGFTPSDDLTCFHKFVKDLISFDVTLLQAKEKIRSLRKKYENNAGRRKFKTEYDKTVHDLSDKIWGEEGVVTLLEQKRNKKRVVVKKEKSNEGIMMSDDKWMIDFIREGNGHNISESFILERLQTLDASKRAELEKDWKKLQLKQLGLAVNRCELSSKVTKYIIGGTS